MNLNRKLVNKEDLMRDVADLEVYKTYAPDLDLQIGKPMLSPLREESTPSFGLFVGKETEILFNDFLLGGGDCIRFVQLMFGDTFFEAMSRIVIDFGLQDKYYYKDIITKKPTVKKDVDKESLLKKTNSSLIRKRHRSWQKYDIEFWNSYGVSYKTLQQYRVEPISHIFLDRKIIAADKYAYSFTERKDGIETYKIYQPFNEKYKWLNNHDESVWQGWEQLPDKGEKLIITKSLKDVMTIKTLSDIPAVSLQAESVKPKPHIIDELKDRFPAIFLWYDNDFDKETNWGMEFGKRLSDEFGFIQIYIPDEYMIKDPSDFAKAKGTKETKELITKLTSLPF